MKIYDYERLGEKLIHHVSPNGLNIYIVPKKDYAKSFAMLAANYGGSDTRFKKDGKWLDTPAGIAHFLEHTGTFLIGRQIAVDRRIPLRVVKQLLLDVIPTLDGCIDEILDGLGIIHLGAAGNLGQQFGQQFSRVVGGLGAYFNIIHKNYSFPICRKRMASTTVLQR